MYKSAALAALAMAFAATPALAAPMLGDTVTCASQGFTCSPQTATISNGLEFSANIGTPYLSVDFAPGLLTITNLTSGVSLLTEFNLRFTDTTNPFSSATLLGTSSVVGFSQSNLSVSGGLLTVNLNNTQFSNSGANIRIALDSATSGVPEPASWGMMLLGFGALGYTMRRREKVSTRIRFA